MRPALTLLLVLVAGVLVAGVLAEKSLQNLKVRLATYEKDGSGRLHRRHHRHTTLRRVMHEVSTGAWDDSRTTLGLEMELMGTGTVGLIRTSDKKPGNGIGVFYDDLVAHTAFSSRAYPNMPLISLVIDHPSSAGVFDPLDLNFKSVKARAQGNHIYAKEMADPVVYGKGGIIEVVTAPICASKSNVWQNVVRSVAEFINAFNTASQKTPIDTIVGSYNTAVSKFCTDCRLTADSLPASDFRLQKNVYVWVKQGGRIRSPVPQLSFSLPLASFTGRAWVDTASSGGDADDVKAPVAAYSRGPAWAADFATANFKDAYAGANTVWVKGLLSIFFAQTYMDANVISAGAYDGGANKDVTGFLVKACPEDIIRATGILSTAERAALVAWVTNVFTASSSKADFFKNLGTGDTAIDSKTSGIVVAAFTSVFVPKVYDRYPGETTTAYGTFVESTRGKCTTRTSKPIQPFLNGIDPVVVVEARHQSYPWPKALSITTTDYKKYTLPTVAALSAMSQSATTALTVTDQSLLRPTTTTFDAGRETYYGTVPQDTNRASIDPNPFNNIEQDQIQASDEGAGADIVNQDDDETETQFDADEYQNEDGW